MNGGNGRIFHMLRRGEVRLTGGAVHDVNALLAQLFGLGNRGHSGGGLNAADAGGKANCFQSGRSHAFFFLLEGWTMRGNSFNLYAGSILASRFFSTISGTSPLTGPPFWATSRIRRELT